MKKKSKDNKKKNLVDTDSINQVENNLDVDENIIFTLVQKEMNMSILRK